MPVDHTEIITALKDRQKWEDRQATWYKMRHDGLRRINKPFPGAADMHFPLADMQIEKLKPFYVSQLYATDTVASFLAKKSEAGTMASEAALWFDSQLKHESNFEDEIAIGIDKMLNCAVVPVKVYWDAQRERLAFEAINPIHLIVPTYTGRLADADWIVHVQKYSKHAYKRIAEFDSTPETMAVICAGEAGQEGTGAGTASTYESAKLEREGITSTKTKGQIIVWEVFTRNAAGQWEVATYSPAAPTRPLRPPFLLPYNRGVFGEKLPPPPFFELTMERKDRGYYDPRGVVERVAPFEASLCKDWNTLKDWQTQTSNPTYSAPKGIPANTGTLRHVPGQIYPFELQALQQPAAPVDITAAMQGTRAVAEQLVGAPDFGTQQQGKDNKTAKEVTLIANVMGQSTDMRARQFRRELGAGLRMAWAICLQYRANARSYRTLEGYAELTPEALQQDYQIELNASGDNWNRQQVIQQAQSMFQMFRGDPFIEQFELRREVLNALDPRKAKKLLLNAGQQQAMQLEDQAQEISIMLLGFPAEVRETDDHLLHIQSALGFLQRRMSLGQPIGPEMVVLMHQHLSAHAQAAAKMQKDQWQQAEAQLAPQLQMLAAAAQQAQAALQQQAMMMQQQQAALAAAQPAGPAPAAAQGGAAPGLAQPTPHPFDT
jgi:hypothetical protein